MYRLLFVPLLALVLAACGQSTPPRADLAPTAQPERSAARQQADIEAAVDGLLYLSESDYPWTYNPVPKPRLSDWLESREGLELEQRRSFKAFFDQLTDPDATGDDAERYRRLERTLRRHFSRLTVYWIIDPADPVRVRLVILGKNRLGVFALETVSIET